VVYSLAPPLPPEAGRGEGGPPSLASLLEAAAVEVHCLDGRHVWHFPRVVRELKQRLATQRPQLVETFLFHANLVGRIAARHSGVGRVVCGVRVAERRSRWHLWLDRLTQHQVDRYVCVSRSVARFAEREGGLPAEKLAVIPNGIDLSRYPSRQPADLSQLGIPAGHRAITFVGRLERQKGVLWLLETATQWLSRLPDCHLLLVGTGPLRWRLEAAAASQSIAGRVHLALWRPDVPEILAASSLLVLPSAWEGMPNVVLEAMASGLPLVATDVEGVEELLGPRTAEQTVRYGDSQPLADRIVALMNDQQARARLGAENRRRAEKEFGFERMVSAYQDLWESLLT
jgi:glycosyltransferase involved in cell wall biosynthesis